METLLATIVNWVIDHLPLLGMIGGGLAVLYFRLPGIWSWVSAKVAGWTNKSVTTVPVTTDVIQLLNGMVASLPSIKDEALHKQSVEACVSFAEAVIREAGLATAAKENSNTDVK